MKNPLNWLGWLGLMFLLAGTTGLSGADVSEAAGNTTESALLPGHAEPHSETHGEGHAHHHGVEGQGLSVLWVIPFVGMLLSIALGPILAPHFWHANYGKVAAGWIVLFSIPFLATYKGDAFYEILHIVLLDYVPFIILLGALFTAAGGICLKGSLRGSPTVNTAILFIGTVLASWMGTTGAAMLVDGFQPLAQELLTYTSPGGICRLPMTVSVDLKAGVDDQETGRERDAAKWRNSSYSLVKGKIVAELANNKAYEVPVEVSLRFGGRASEVSDDGVAKLEGFNPGDWSNQGGDPINNSSTVSWKTSIKPGECFKPTIDYEFYLRN